MGRRSDAVVTLTYVWGLLAVGIMLALAVTALAYALGVGEPVSQAVSAMFSTANLALAALIASITLLVPIGIVYFSVLRIREYLEDREPSTGSRMRLVRRHTERWLARR